MNANVMVLSGDTVIRPFTENRSHARIVPFRIYVFIKLARMAGNAPDISGFSDQHINFYVTSGYVLIE